MKPWAKTKALFKRKQLDRDLEDELAFHLVNLASKWPDDYQVMITLTLIEPTAGKKKRPYVAVWIEDQLGHGICDGPGRQLLGDGLIADDLSCGRGQDR